MTSDLDLLRQFARENSQDAFAEIVRRHLNLAYSAARRQVRSPQLAEDIAQSVFADLAREAGKLKPDTILTAWLYSVTRRTAIDAIRKESRRQLREQIAVEMNTMNAQNELSHFAKCEKEPAWPDIEPLLDDAMAALDETDRSAILLRYFENKSLREVGEAMGASEDAAQKRVSRAVDRLREFFSKRNVTIGASGLAVSISANAVQAAPAGLAATISAAAVLAGTAVHTSTVVATTKAIAMTALQKTFVAAVAVLAGAGIYEAHQAAQLRDQVQTLQQQQAPMAGQIRQLQHERDDATNWLAGLIAENQQLKSNPGQIELLKLRGEVGVLTGQMNNQAGGQQLAEKLSAQAEFIRDDEARKSNAKLIAMGILGYVYGKGGKLPADFSQVTNAVYENYPNGFVRADDFSSFEFINLGTEVFIHDTRGVTANPDMADRLVEFREKVARQAPDGIWYRIYGFFGVGGRVETATSSDGNFDAWEKANTYTPPPNNNR
jgi:RNA polymerase sigma factor (sigma-70 family)